MSSDEVREIITADCKYRTNRRRDDPDVFYDKNGLLNITVFQEELDEVNRKILNVERQQLAKQAVEDQVPITRFINKVLLRRAGAQKRSKLQREGKIPPPPPRVTHPQVFRATPTSSTTSTQVEQPTTSSAVSSGIPAEWQLRKADLPFVDQQPESIASPRTNFSVHITTQESAFHHRRTEVVEPLNSGTVNEPADEVKADDANKSDTGSEQQVKQKVQVHQQQVRMAGNSDNGTHDETGGGCANPPPIPPELTPLLLKLTAIKTDMDDYNRQVKDHITNQEQLSPEEIEIISEKIDELSKEFDSLYREIITHEEFLSMPDSSRLSEKLRQHRKLMVKDQAAIRALRKGKESPASDQAQNNNNSNAGSGVSSVASDLPKLQIPKFSGNWREWLSFRDMFKALVYDRPDAQVAPIKKLQYLKQALEGDALRTIQSIPMTANSLKRAWDALLDKYDNNSRLKQEYILDLDNLKPLQLASAYKIRQLYDQVNENREALATLGEKVDQWDAILVTKLISCLDNETRKFYQIGVVNQGAKNVTWKMATEFVNNYCTALENSQSSSSRNQDSGPPKPEQQKRSTVLTATVKSQQQQEIKCNICAQQHFTYTCPTLVSNNNIDEKRELVKNKNLCFNCLRPGHCARNCLSKNTCKHCRRKHHSELHMEQCTPPPPAPTTSKVEEPKEVKTHSNHATSSIPTVLLPTARILVDDKSEIPISCRALLDSGSQVTFIREELVQKLGLQRKASTLPIGGIGNGDAEASTEYVNITIKSSYDPYFKLSVTAHVLPQVTGTLPSTVIDTQKWRHINCLKLADPDYNKPGKIDVLLGADATWNILLDESSQGPRHAPSAKSTVFGWVVAGKVQNSAQETKAISHVAILKQSSNVPQGRQQVPPEVCRKKNNFTRNVKLRQLQLTPHVNNASPTRNWKKTKKLPANQQQLRDLRAKLTPNSTLMMNKMPPYVKCNDEKLIRCNYSTVFPTGSKKCSSNQVSTVPRKRAKWKSAASNNGRGPGNDNRSRIKTSIKQDFRGFRQ